MHVQRVLRPAAVGFVAVLLSGCWLQPGWGPTRQNFNSLENTLTSANVATLAPAWSSGTALRSEPLASSAAVYTAQVDGDKSSGFALHVEATDRNSGARLWRRDDPIGDPATIR